MMNAPFLIICTAISTITNSLAYKARYKVLHHPEAATQAGYPQQFRFLSQVQNPTLEQYHILHKAINSAILSPFFWERLKILKRSAISIVCGR